MRPYRSGSSSGTRSEPWRSSSSIGSGRSAVGAKTAWSSSGTPTLAARPLSHAAEELTAPGSAPLRRSDGVSGSTRLTLPRAMKTPIQQRRPRRF